MERRETDAVHWAIMHFISERNRIRVKFSDIWLRLENMLDLNFADVSLFAVLFDMEFDLSHVLVHQIKHNRIRFLFPSDRSTYTHSN